MDARSMKCTGTVAFILIVLAAGGCAQTERAQSLGIFGAPSFTVADELYWGNDRLGDAIAKAALG